MINKEKQPDEIRVNERPKDQYTEFEAIVRKNFEALASDLATPLFYTKAEGLFEAYISNMVKAGQAHYTCTACRQFIERYGNLVTIDNNGKIVSALWNIEVPKYFTKSVNAMKEIVENSEIRTVFISDVAKLGIPKTGVWTHLSAKLPRARVNNSRVKTAGQLMAEKLEDYRALRRALGEFTSETIANALRLIETGELDRGDKCVGVAEWFNTLKKDTEAVKASNIDDRENVVKNIIWMYVATAPAGYTHIKSSMIGTLLDDISSGMSTQYVISRFNEKMNPEKYMRSENAPTAGAIAQAEKMVEQMGIADSLHRRYATLEDLEEFIWRSKGLPVKPKEEVKKTGVFSSVKPREKSVKHSNGNSFDLPMSTMTWEKFKQTILPNVVSLEAKVEPARLMALVTAENPDSENILQWSNPVSWYYHSGVDANIRDRLKSYGARYDDNEIRCSLAWDGPTDLDLHCITPECEHIYYSRKRSKCGGYLDLDMNGLDKKSNTPVENIRWVDNAPDGHYKFYINNYAERVNRFGTEYTVELEIGGKVYHCKGKALRGDERRIAFEFDYIRGSVNNMVVEGDSNVHAKLSENEWNINSEFMRVNAIVPSPNVWGKNNVLHAGQHIFFLLDGCKDMSDNKGKGFFTEMLKPELHEIRRVLGAFTDEEEIAGLEESNASGVGYSIENDWGLVLRVNTGESTRLIKIDRWD